MMRTTKNVFLRGNTEATPAFRATDITGLVFVILALGIWLVYGQVVHFGFISFDDPFYIYENSWVRQGLSIKGIQWAFSVSEDQNYWHPLTWISLMADVSAVGLSPGRMHAVNIIIHFFNSFLLYLFFRRATGGEISAGVVALFFALHPLNVESVAWISERKNVLSGLFLILTLLSYEAYARRPSFSRYILIAFFFALGLMTKPGILILPGILFLLDIWPLCRLTPDRKNMRSILLRLLEKIPLLLLSVACVLISFYALRVSSASSFQPEVVPFSLRLSNALVTIWKYAALILIPGDLGLFYPFPTNIPPWQPLTALAGLFAVSGYILFRIRTAPVFTVGWGWFLMALLPVLGLKRGGLWPELADRWAYLPQIGIWIILCYGLPPLISARYRRTVCTGAATSLLLTFGVLASIQTGYWRNSISLFERAVSVTRNNWLMKYDLGTALEADGRLDEAIRQYREALAIHPADVDSRYNLAVCLVTTGRTDAGEKEYEVLLSRNPNHAMAHNNLGLLLQGKGDLTGAIHHYEQAIAGNPQLMMARINQGNALNQAGHPELAVSHLQKVLEKDPRQVFAIANLASSYMALHQYEAAVRQWQAAILLQPEDARFYFLLAQSFQNLGMIDKARQSLDKALMIAPDNANYLELKNRLSTDTQALSVEGGN